MRVDVSTGIGSPVFIAQWRAVDDHIPSWQGSLEACSECYFPDNGAAASGQAVRILLASVIKADLHDFTGLEGKRSCDAGSTTAGPARQVPWHPPHGGPCRSIREQTLRPFEHIAAQDGHRVTLDRIAGPRYQDCREGGHIQKARPPWSPGEASSLSAPVIIAKVFATVHRFSVKKADNPLVRKVPTHYPRHQ